MRLIRIQESYERGVFMLKDAEHRDASQVGNLRQMLRVADARARMGATTVVVVNQDAHVVKCLRYRPGIPVIEEDPQSVYV